MAVVCLQPQPPPPTPKQQLDTDYLRTTPALLRIAEGVLSLAALICVVEGGYCLTDSSRYGYSLFITIVTMLEAIFITAFFVFRLEAKIPFIDVPLSLLINDGIMLINYFITSTMALLAIGRCRYAIAARLIAALFILSIFLVLVGLSYINYIKWQERRSNTNTESAKNSGTTITESSPTVLT